MPINIIQRLLPRGENFTAHFRELAEALLRAGRTLAEIISCGSIGAADLVCLREIEQAGDVITRTIILAANRTFNAPIDREDILALAQALDDGIDLIEDVAKAIHRYDVRDFPPTFLLMADAIVAGLELVQDALPLLDDIGRNYDKISKACEAIGAAEGRADDAFDRGMVELRKTLKEGKIDLLAYIDRKEVLELLEEAADRSDDIAKALRTVTAKHV